MIVMRYRYTETGKNMNSAGSGSAGLYRTKDGTVINADINGSANIIRKAIPEAFEGMTDFAFLQSAETVGFRDLHPLKAKQM